MNILIQKRNRNCWHKWFAWYPVCVHTYPDGAKKYTWLSMVLRKIFISPGEVGNEYRYYKEAK
jgi:hypothetical protein